MAERRKRKLGELRIHRGYGAHDLRDNFRGEAPGIPAIMALYLAHVTQADQGCDFDFLAAGEATPEPEIHG